MINLLVNNEADEFFSYAMKNIKNNLFYIDTGPYKENNT